jgi:hypothetical protein
MVGTRTADWIRQWGIRTRVVNTRQYQKPRAGSNRATDQRRYPKRSAPGSFQSRAAAPSRRWRKCDTCLFKTTILAILECARDT